MNRHCIVLHNYCIVLSVKVERRNSCLSDHWWLGGLPSDAASGHRWRVVSHLSQTHSPSLLQGSFVNLLTVVTKKSMLPFHSSVNLGVGAHLHSLALSQQWAANAAQLHGRSASSLPYTAITFPVVIILPNYTARWQRRLYEQLARGCFLAVEWPRVEPITLQSLVCHANH